MVLYSCEVYKALSKLTFRMTFATFLVTDKGSQRTVMLKEITWKIDFFFLCFLCNPIILFIYLFLQVGDILYCAGQIGLVPCTMQLVSGGVWTEATVALSHVEKVLQAMSQKTTLLHVITAICYVTDSKHIPVAHSVWKKKLRDCKKVAVISTSLILSCLFPPDVL